MSNCFSVAGNIPWRDSCREFEIQPQQEDADAVEMSASVLGELDVAVGRSSNVRFLGDQGTKVSS